VGELHAVAMNMQFNPDVPAGPHRFVMTAPRERVAMVGSRPPEVMLMSSEDVSVAEYGVWIFDDYQVQAGKSRDFKWAERHEGDPELADLSKLSGGLALRQELLLAQAGDRSVSGAVRIATGVGTPALIVENKTVDLIRLGDPHAAQLASAAGPGYKLADYVEVAIDLGTSTSFTLTAVKRGGGSVSSLTFNVEKNNPCVVTFTNLCSLPHRDVDEEFAGLYECLHEPPLPPDRLVPKERSTRGFLHDCYTAGYVPFAIG
jgi:hypothetical protein